MIKEEKLFESINIKFCDTEWFQCEIQNNQNNHWGSKTNNPNILFRHIIKKQLKVFLSKRSIYWFMLCYILYK